MKNNLATFYLFLFFFLIQFLLVNKNFIKLMKLLFFTDSTPYIAPPKAPFTLTCKNATNNSTVWWEHNHQRINNATLFEIKNNSITIHRLDDGIFNTTVACFNNDTKAQINAYQIFRKFNN